MPNSATGRRVTIDRLEAIVPFLGQSTRDSFRLGLLIAGLAVLYGPTFWDLNRFLWVTETQSFGPLILFASLWLFWRDRHALSESPLSPQISTGFAILIPSLLLYALGRAQDIWIFEVGTLLSTVCALLLLFKGASAVKLVGVQLALMAFLIPWPESLVVVLTGPLKAAVSAAAATLLHLLGYPVGRTGVMLTVGQYQFLVADACAGLNSILSLEAIGLIYMKLMNYQSAMRNLVLALVLVPISLVSNLMRVIILILVTYHFGDGVGQGFSHDAAGITLFTVATALMLLADGLLLAAVKFGRRLRECYAE